MQIVEFDASRWSRMEDLYGAIYEALGSPYSACNINALMEGIYWDRAYDDLNGVSRWEFYKVKPPFKLRVLNASRAPKSIADELALVRDCLDDAHREFREMWNGRDVVIEFEIVQASSGIATSEC